MKDFSGTSQCNYRLHKWAEEVNVRAHSIAGEMNVL